MPRGKSRVGYYGRFRRNPQRFPDDSFGIVGEIAMNPFGFVRDAVMIPPVIDFDTPTFKVCGLFLGGSFGEGIPALGLDGDFGAVAGDEGGSQGGLCDVADDLYAGDFLDFLVGVEGDGE